MNCPLLSNATQERHKSSLFAPVCIILTAVSLKATTELVVPKSIPIAFPILNIFICLIIPLLVLLILSPSLRFPLQTSSPHWLSHKRHSDYLCLQNFL